MLTLRHAFKDAQFDPTVGTEVVMAFPDGFKIIRLLTPEAKDYESQQLHHCVGDGAYDDGKTDIYSLRDTTNKPLATLEIKDKILKQCKGVQNTPPDSDAFPYLKDFIVEHGLKLKEDPGYTGLARHRGKYYSIFALPRGVKLASLDLTMISKPLVLPENLHIRGHLSIAGYNMRIECGMRHIQSKVSLPKNFKAKEVCFHQKERGKLHNANGPSILGFDDLGNLVREGYHINGQRGRKGLPAEIEYENKRPKKFAHFENDQLHNPSGPTCIWFDPDGSIRQMQWIWKNTLIAKPQDDPVFQKAWKIWSASAPSYSSCYQEVTPQPY